MEIWHAVVLGVVQGLAEFIPISSSGHLAWLHWLFGWSHGERADLAFDVSLHVGTLIALLIYFGRDWLDLLRVREQRPLLGMVMLACVPGAVLGVLLEHKAETVFRSPLHIGLLLGIAGIIMWICDHTSKRQRDMARLTWSDAIWVGVSQALAIMPGVSRSGSTITAGLVCGLTREAAARFSFLLSAPIIAGAALFESRNLLGAGIGVPWTSILAGIIAAAVSGYFAIDFLLNYLRRHSLDLFVVYRIVIAVVMIATFLLRGNGVG